MFQPESRSHPKVMLAFAHGDDAELARRTRAMTERCARAHGDDWIRVSRWLAMAIELSK
jgi:hypothetical protein